MRIVMIVVAIGLALAGHAAHGRPDHSPSAPDGQREIREAAKRLLGMLNEEQRAAAMFAFEDGERFNFHFIPRPRAGLSLKDMTPVQRSATHDLLQKALSAGGYRKVTGIIQLEEILFSLSNRSRVRDPELYYLTFFGAPSAEAPWGWRFEGHHLSLNFSSIDGALFSTTPAFLGTNPAEVRAGPSTGLRVLAAEETLARTLVQALDPAQRERAIISARAPSDIITGANRKASIARFEGLPAGAMTEAQIAMLWRIVVEYAHNLRPEMAEAQLARIRDAGIENLHFAWAGGIDPGQPHYYRIHGPTVLFEYDNVQNGANHVHSVWRDFENDFGEDLLRRHYETAPDGHGHAY